MEGVALDNQTGVTPNTVGMVLLGLPGSLNQIYELNRHDSGLPRRRLKAEWALWKSRAKPLVPLCNFPADCFFKVEMWFESPSWWCKNGSLRRRDVDNLEKLVLDTIFEKLDRDDSRVICKISHKVVGPDDQVTIILTEVYQWQSAPIVLGRARKS